MTVDALIRQSVTTVHPGRQKLLWPPPGPQPSPPSTHATVTHDIGSCLVYVVGCFFFLFGALLVRGPHPTRVAPWLFTTDESDCSAAHYPGHSLHLASPGQAPKVDAVSVVSCRVVRSWTIRTETKCRICRDIHASISEETTETGKKLDSIRQVALTRTSFPKVLQQKQRRLSSTFSLGSCRI